MKDKAIKLIDTLKDYYNADRFHFDMNINMFLAGPNNKALRQEIVLILTGTKMPATKCGVSNISTLLKARLEQTTLF